MTDYESMTEKELNGVVDKIVDDLIDLLGKYPAEIAIASMVKLIVTMAVTTPDPTVAMHTVHGGLDIAFDNMLEEGKGYRWGRQGH